MFHRTSPSNRAITFALEHKIINSLNTPFILIAGNHSTPQTNLSSPILKIFENKKNIMMMHCSVGAWYLMQEFGEWVYPTNKKYIFSKMDYVALGHWHGFGKVGKHENVYYSGSLERTSLNDKRNTKGFTLITFDDTLTIEYKEIKSDQF